MNGAASMVAILSRRFGITRVAMMPGTAQAKLEIIGMMDWPDKPAERITLSIKYAARAR